MKVRPLSKKSSDMEFMSSMEVITTVIRNVYNMYLGWYSGEPSELGEVSRPERGKKLTALIGRDKLVAGIEKAKADGDLN